MVISKTVIGRRVKERRVALGLTQEQLGARAGYKSGAAVSIFRVEAGRVMPKGERLKGIAYALGMSPDELVAETAAVALSDDQGDSETTLRQLRERVEARFEERQRTLQDRGEWYNELASAAVDELAIPFIALCREVENMPVGPQEPPPPPPSSAGPEERVSWANRQFNWEFAGAGLGFGAGAGVGGLGAAGLFAAVGAWGTASTGAAIGGLSGVAAWNATMAAIGGGAISAGGFGIAGGMAVLGGLVALPAVIAAGGVYALARIRNQRQQWVKLIAAEEFLDGSQERYEAVIEHLRESSDILRIASVHGGWAFECWRESLEGSADQPVRDWGQMSAGQRAAQQRLNQVVACLSVLLALTPQALLHAPSVSHPTLAELEGVEASAVRPVVTVSAEALESGPGADVVALTQEVEPASFEELRQRYRDVRNYVRTTIRKALGRKE